MTATNTKAELEQLLQRRNDEPKRALEIEAQIHQRFGITSAVFVLDLAGFSRLTLRYGIVQFSWDIATPANDRLPRHQKLRGHTHQTRSR
ncbi:MAG: hypothetical protein AAFY26_19780 [Cyanobacteria bacterium J06638_22]